MKETFKERLVPALFGIYCAALMIQNVLATKTIDVAVFSVTTGVLVSPIVFIIQDITSELFGFKIARRMILLSFVMNFIAALLFQLAILLPPSATFANQEGFAAVLGSTLRITCASFAAYIAGGLLNSKIMTALRERTEKGLFFRAISSTVVGQFADNAIFVFGAFAFVLPFPVLVSMIIGATLFEIIYEIVFYPVTNKAIKVLKAKL